MSDCFSKHFITKGQIKPKTDWRAVDSPKKRTNEFAFFDMKSCYVVKSNAVRSFFGRIYGAPFCLQFYLTFSKSKIIFAGIPYLLR